MNTIRLRITRDFLNDTLYDLELTSPLTVVNDLSGTGKTALAKLVNNPQDNAVQIMVTGVDEVVCVTDELSVLGASADNTKTRLFIIDENTIEPYWDNVYLEILSNNWPCLIITRDASRLNLFGYIFEESYFIEEECIRIKYKKDVRYVKAPTHEISSLYVEDSTSGKDFYRALLPMNIAVNPNQPTKTVGFGEILRLLLRNDLTDNTMVIADGTTYSTVARDIEDYLFLRNVTACVYTPLCTEWLLLHIPLFAGNEVVSRYLNSKVSEDPSKNTEEYAYHLITTVIDDIRYAKSKNKLDWRFFTKDSMTAIAKELPSAFSKYLKDFSVSTNISVRSQLCHLVVTSPKFDSSKCNGSNYFECVEEYLRINDSITDFYTVLQQFSTCEKLSLFSLAANDSVKGALACKGVTDVCSKLFCMLDSSKTYTVEEVLDLIARS